MCCITTSNPIPSDSGYGPIPSAMSTQASASPGSSESEPKMRHSSFSSTVRKLAKVLVLKSVTSGLSTALALDNTAVPNPSLRHSLEASLAMPLSMELDLDMGHCGGSDGQGSPT